MSDSIKTWQERAKLVMQTETISSDTRSGIKSRCMAEEIAELRAERVSTFNSPVAAIQYALEKCEDNDDSMLFLRWWNEGEFDKIRRNFEDVPEDVFIGADPLYKKGQL